MAIAYLLKQIGQKERKKITQPFNKFRIFILGTLMHSFEIEILCVYFHESHIWNHCKNHHQSHSHHSIKWAIQFLSVWVTGIVWMIFLRFWNGSAGFWCWLLLLFFSPYFQSWIFIDGQVKISTCHRLMLIKSLSPIHTNAIILIFPAAIRL